MGVEVPLAIPREALAVTAEPCSDEVRSDLIEQPVSLGLTQLERACWVEPVNHTMAEQPQQTILATPTRTEEQQPKLICRKDLLPVENPGDLSITLSRPLRYLPSDRRSDSLTSPRRRQTNHPPLSRVGSTGVLLSHATTRASWQQGWRWA